MGQKNGFHESGKERKAGVEIFISDKIDFKTKAIKKYKEGHHLMIKGSIQEEDITLVIIYAPNIGSPKYIQQILPDIKGETDGNTIILGNVNTLLTSMGRLSIQRINKAIEIINDTIAQLDLVDVFRILLSKNKINILFKCTWNIL
uniref:Uncharacterized protein n=1 Tax=Sus scrofa TaxID=9823 RepID=A0A8D1QNZ5_PIG